MCRFWVTRGMTWERGWRGAVLRWFGCTGPLHAKSLYLCNKKGYLHFAPDEFFFFFWNKTNTFKDFEVECCRQPSETVDQPPVLFLLSRLGLCVINPFENSLSTSKRVQPKAYCCLKMVPLPLNTENLVCVYLKIFLGGGWWNFLLWGLHQQGLWPQVMTVSSWPSVASLGKRSSVLPLFWIMLCGKRKQTDEKESFKCLLLLLLLLKVNVKNRVRTIRLIKCHKAKQADSRMDLKLLPKKEKKKLVCWLWLTFWTLTFEKMLGTELKFTVNLKLAAHWQLLIHGEVFFVLFNTKVREMRVARELLTIVTTTTHKISGEVRVKNVWEPFYCDVAFTPECQTWYVAVRSSHVQLSRWGKFCEKKELRTGERTVYLCWGWSSSATVK